MTAPGATGFSWTGIALESTKGTAETAPVVGIPLTRADYEDATDILPDQGMRGSMATIYGAVKGTQSASYSMEGDVFLDTIGFPLAAIFGEATFDDYNEPVYEHVFALNNDRTTTKGQAPGYTIFDYNGLQVRKYAGATCSSFTLRMSAQELLTWTADWTTKASATDSDDVPEFGALAPVAAWVGTINHGNVSSQSSVSTIQEAEITFSRNVSVVQTVDGSTNPIQIWQGPLSVSGRLLFVADAETEFTAYLGATPRETTLTFAQGTGSLVVDFSKIVYNSAKVERGEDFTQVSAQFDAIANTTDVGPSGGYGPCTVTLTNGVDEDIFISPTAVE